jgi:hypothetical protein
VTLLTQVLTLQHPSVLVRHQHCVWVKEFGLADQEAANSWMTAHPSITFQIRRLMRRQTNELGDHRLARHAFSIRQFIGTRKPLRSADGAIEAQCSLIQEFSQGLAPEGALINFLLAARAQGCESEFVSHAVFTQKGLQTEAEMPSQGLVSALPCRDSLLRLKVS